LSRNSSFNSLLAVQIDPSAEQEPSLAFDHAALLAALPKELGASYFINCFVGVLHDVKLVVYDAASRHPAQDAGGKRLPPI
jgi:hypothetical protein